MPARKKDKVAIIGAGPAGVAAAIQLKRMSIDAFLFERERIGGLLNNAYLVENYPGFPAGIRGIELAGRFKDHLKKWRVKVIEKEVTHVRKTATGYALSTGENFSVSKVIVASGTRAKIPVDLGELRGNRVVTEVYPIRNVRKKMIVIVGSGDAAFDYALNLSQSNSVVLLNRRKHVKGLDLLYRRIRSRRKWIRYLTQTEVVDLRTSGKRLHVNLTTRGKMSTMICDYVVYAIGREPALDFLSAPLRRKFPVGDRHLFFVGDVKRGGFRQTAIAVGDGVEAAMRIGRESNCV